MSVHKYFLAIGDASKCGNPGCRNTPKHSISTNEHDVPDLCVLSCPADLGTLVTTLSITYGWRVLVDPYTAPTPPPAPKATIEELRKTREIYSIGKTPEEAIEALGQSLGWGKIANMNNLEGGCEELTWGRRFTADGTGMKAAGWSVPGGVVLSWWK